MGETISVGRREDLTEATQRIRKAVIDAYMEIENYEYGRIESEAK